MNFEAQVYIKELLVINGWFYFSHNKVLLNIVSIFGNSEQTIILRLSVLARILICSPSRQVAKVFIISY